MTLSGGRRRFRPPASRAAVASRSLRSHRLTPPGRALAAITIAAALLRFSTLDVQSFAHAESVTVTRVLMPGLGDTLGAVLSSERSGPVYYSLAWAWAKLFGTGEVGLRSLSALVGTLTVPVVYLIAAEVASRRAAVIAAALTAVNPFLFWYSQEARSYALYVLLSALALLFFVRALDDRSPRYLVAWVLASVLSLATHYFAVFLIAPQALWLMYVNRDRRTIGAVIATAVAGLLLLPLALAQQGEGRQDNFAGTPLVERALDAGVRFAGGGLPQIGPTVPGLEVDAVSVGLACASAVLAVFAIAMLLRGGDERERRGGLVVAAIATLAFLVPFALAAGGLDLVRYKNLIGALAPAVVAVAAGLGTRRAGMLGPVVAATLGVTFAIALAAQLVDHELQRPDVRGVAQWLGPTEGKRLVMGPSVDDDSFLLYLGSEDETTKLKEQRDSATVDEIVVVSTAPRGLDAPVSGFSPVASYAASGFYAHAFRSATPREVNVSTLDAAGLVGAEPIMLVHGGPHR